MQRPIPTVAQICAGSTASAFWGDAGYLHNLAYDQAGDYRGSSLGKSVSVPVCSSKNPTLSDLGHPMIDTNESLERSYGRKAKGHDRTSPWIGKIGDIDLLSPLSEFETSYVGYVDAPMILSRDMQKSDPTGAIGTEDILYFRFEGCDGLELVETETTADWICEEYVIPDSYSALTA